MEELRKGNQCKITHKAGTAGHTDGRWRSKMIPHNALEDAAGQRQTNAHHTAAEDSGQAHIPNN